MIIQIFSISTLAFLSIAMFIASQVWGSVTFTAILGVFLLIVFGANFIIAMANIFDAGGRQARYKSNVNKLRRLM